MPNPSATADHPLYQRILGERFEALHPVLRRFHASPAGGSGSGSFRVTRSGRRLARLVATVMGLPAAGEAVPVQLRVSVRGNAEVWERSFAGRPMVTVQEERGGLLYERSGPVCFVFALEAVNGGMTFRLRRVRVFGIPLPLALGPAVEAEVTPDEAGWTASVAVRVPLLGQLVHYGGRLEPQ